MGKYLLDLRYFIHNIDKYHVLAHAPHRASVLYTAGKREQKKKVDICDILILETFVLLFLILSTQIPPFHFLATTYLGRFLPRTVLILVCKCVTAEPHRLGVKGFIRQLRHRTEGDTQPEVWGIFPLWFSPLIPVGPDRSESGDPACHHGQTHGSGDSEA